MPPPRHALSDETPAVPAPDLIDLDYGRVPLPSAATRHSLRRSASAPHDEVRASDPLNPEVPNKVRVRLTSAERGPVVAFTENNSPPTSCVHSPGLHEMAALLLLKGALPGSQINRNMVAV